MVHNFPRRCGVRHSHHIRRSAMAELLALREEFLHPVLIFAMVLVAVNFRYIASYWCQLIHHGSVRQHQMLYFATLMPGISVSLVLVSLIAVFIGWHQMKEGIFLLSFATASIGASALIGLFLLSKNHLRPMKDNDRVRRQESRRKLLDFLGLFETIPEHFSELYKWRKLGRGNFFSSLFVFVVLILTCGIVAICRHIGTELTKQHGPLPPKRLLPMERWQDWSK